MSLFRSEEDVMTTIVTRIYAAEQKAVAAADAAKRKFGENEVTLVAPNKDPKSDPAAIDEAIVKGGVAKVEAPAYAEQVREGKWVVTVKASWGFANEAVRILDKYEPFDAGITPVEQQAIHDRFDEAAPFSAWMGWAVLRPFNSNIQLTPFQSGIKLINDPAPLSAWFKWDVLKPFKSTLVLSDDPTPLSNKLGIAVLTNSKSSATLAQDDKGKAKLLDNPAPFSEYFNLPVLWKNF